MNDTAVAQSLGATLVGTGPRTVVLGNGLGTSPHSWRFVVEALAPHARLLRFNYPGMSGPLPPHYRPEPYDTLFGFADDLVALLDALDLRQVAYVGHSVSGMIGLLAATAAPERFAEVVTIGASARYLDDVDYHGGFSRDAVDGLLAAAAQDIDTWATAFAPLAMGPDAAPELVGEFVDGLRDMPQEIGVRIMRTIFLGDYRTVLPRVTVPVYVMQPREDVAVPLAAGEFLVQQLPQATLVPLAVRTHVPHLAAPAVLIAALQRVLALPA